MKYISSNKIFNRYKKLVMLLILFMVYLIPMNVKADIVNVGDSQTFDYTGNVQEFIVPKTGLYKLETWGAQGGSGTSTFYGGYGSYSTGLVFLEKGQTIYINVGGQGSEKSGSIGGAGGYNGGGAGGNGATGYSGGNGGGGATHIATKSGLLQSLENNKESILIVSGGGGGYSGHEATYNYVGSGGGISGTKSSLVDGADQSSGYAFGLGQKGRNSTGYVDCGAEGNGGGGGGYYGGRSTTATGEHTNSSGSGGSGYIGNELLTDKKMVMYSDDETYISEDEETKTEITQNVSETPTADYAKSGNGAAKITYIENNNNYLSNLEVEENTLDYTFDKHTTTYNVYILKNETSIHVNAQADDELATVAGDGEIDVSSKPSSVNITVTAENGEIRVYTINIYYVTENETNIFDYTGDVQEFIVPKTGLYKLETWGAQGGGSSTDKNYGGYSTGLIELEKNQKLYIVVGGIPNGYTGGYNGGGSAGSAGSAGGGATHISTSTGLLRTLSNDKDSVLIVSGGGGGSDGGESGGGSGGGFKGTKGGDYGSQYPGGSGGTQTGAGTGGGFGYGGSAASEDGDYGSAGGGGYYGGGRSAVRAGSGGGGSGYIGNELLTDKKMVMYSTDSSFISNEESTKTEITEDVSESPIEDYAKSGNGAARITYVKNNNNYLNALEVEGYSLDNTFDKKLTTYNVYVSEKDTSIQVNAQADDELATVAGDGEIDVSSKPSSVNITVTAEYGDVRVYTINIHYVAKNQPNVFNYTGNEQTFIVPKTGLYKLETWGAQGGNSSYNSYEATGGYGGYSEGIIELEKGDVLYINVGGKGQSVYYDTSSTATTDDGTGYNGGGYGTYGVNNSSHGSGGGATHIATSSGLLSTFKDNTSNVLIVSGGGGGAATHTSYPSYSGTGGSGGGIKGSSGITANSTCYNYGTGGTQTSIGSNTLCSSDGRSNNSGVPAAADFGKGQNYSTFHVADAYAGGGAGYYGGGSGFHGPGAGGSGYIGNSLLSDKKMVMYSEDETYISEDESTKTEITQNVSETPTADYAKSGNGAAKITYVENTNNYLSNLEVEEYILDNTFDKKLTTYNIFVSEKDTSIHVNAQVEDDLATVAGDGEIDITTKPSSVNITVTAEDGDIRVYTININYVINNQPNVFNYTGNEQVFIATKTGKYKLETWGAQGGNSSYNSYEATGGYGAYSEGIIELNKDDILYINVGGKGQSVYYNTSSTPTTDDGIGYNGGGYGSWYSNNSSRGGGGGTTHIATSSGLLSTFKDNTSNVLIVAGGGGGSATHSSYPSYSGTGGSGGGIKGSSGITLNSACYNYGTGGTQTSIGSNTVCSSDGHGNNSNVPAAADFGKGQSNSEFKSYNEYAGGGAGFYGGGSGYQGPGAGGSGYIGNELLTDKKMVMYSEDETYISEDQSTKTEITQNVSETPTADYAKKGNGAAKITYLPSTNNHLSNLEVEGYELKETFDKETTEYTLAVPSDTDTINIIATPEDSDVSITGTGEKSITETLTTFNIVVTAESGEVRIYTLTVRKRQLLCRRASELHKGTLKGNSIKYGSLYTDKDTLTAQDAFTCDVNDDGIYDEDLERFYFISDYYNTETNEFDSNYAAMLYSYNTYNGEIVKNTTDNNYKTYYQYDYVKNTYGPSEKLLNNIPSKEKWSNVNLYIPVRHLLDPKGNKKHYGREATIDYSSYAGRLLTFQEMYSTGLINDLDRLYTSNLYATYKNTPNVFQERESFAETIEELQRYDSYYPLTFNASYAVVDYQNYKGYGIRPAIDVHKSQFDLRSGNNYLSTLNVSGFLTNFDKDTMEYNIIVPYLTDTINITGTVDDVNSTATGFGEYAFDGITMTKEIEVTAENGNKRVYTLNIEKDLTNTDLETLDIDIYGLNEKFDNNRLEYTVSISKSTTNLNIRATTVEPGVVVEGIGEIEITKDLTYLPIVITAKDGTTTKTITIRILRTLCIRAKTLHQEICEEGSKNKNNGCGRDGYYLGGSKNTTTITYGNMGSGNTLNAGDAFTCDVNADGQFNEENERFYYVSDYYDGETNSFNNDYATLIYYSNTLDGVPDNSDGNISYADSTGLKGPTSAYLELPSTSQWPNSVLYKQTRQINSFSGSSIKNNDNSLLQFTYTDKGSRLLTYQELASACDITLEDNNSVINECNFLFEGSVYTSVNTYSQKAGFVLENPKTINGGIRSVSGLQKNLLATDMTSPYVKIGVRPVIDVLKQDINLYSNNNYLSNLSIDGYTLNEEFYKYNQDYTVILPAGVKNVNVIATPEDESSVVAGAGESETPLGESIINVLVTSISGEVRTYTITVTREADTNLNISEINVTGGTLNGQLDNTVNEYTIKPDTGASSITIEVIPESESATVSGNNVIVLDNKETETTITVTAEDGSTREVKFTILSYDSIEVDEEDITMVAGDTKVIEITNDVPEEEIDIVSSDGNIASVSGLIITGVSKGEVTITLSLKSDNTITKTINVTVLSDKLESDSYRVLDKTRPKSNEDDPDITDRIIIGADAGVTISEFKENMLNPIENLKVYDKDGILIESDEEIIRTGLKIKLIINDNTHDEAIIILRGDIDGDGLIDVTDESYLMDHILEIALIDDYKFYAADLNDDHLIDVTDESYLMDYILEIRDSLNNIE